MDMREISRNFQESLNISAGKADVKLMLLNYSLCGCVAPSRGDRDEKLSTVILF